MESVLLSQYLSDSHFQPPLPMAGFTITNLLSPSSIRPSPLSLTFSLHLSLPHPHTLFPDPL